MYSERLNTELVQYSDRYSKFGSRRVRLSEYGTLPNSNSLNLNWATIYISAVRIDHIRIHRTNFCMKNRKLKSSDFGAFRYSDVRNLDVYCIILSRVNMIKSYKWLMVVKILFQMPNFNLVLIILLL